MASRIAEHLLTGRLAFLLGGLLDLTAYALAAPRARARDARDAQPPAPAA
jgi:hypothetical protein